MRAPDSPTSPERSAFLSGPHAISGWVRPGLERIAQAFADNFRRRGEKGAAFAVYRDGRPVVDLWGGMADVAATRPWEPDTLQMIFSGTKGLVASCMLVLAERGQLSLEDRVAEHWPEFGAHGKGAVTVREVLGHSARLPVLRRRATLSDLLDPARMSARLAAQALEPDPRAALTYHALTYGWICGELVRRIDGRTIGRFFHEEIALPLRLDVWIGLPPHEEARASTLTYGQGFGRAYFDRRPPEGDPGLDWRRNPPVFPATGPIWNAREVHAAEIPAVNGFATARSMARLYGCLACGGTLDGAQHFSRDAIDRARWELSRGWDELNRDLLRYGSGFALQVEGRPLGPPDDAFGHDGAGGTVHAAWPSDRIGVSYVTNEMRDETVPDARAAALLQATFDAFAGRRVGDD